MKETRTTLGNLGGRRRVRVAAAIACAAVVSWAGQAGPAGPAWAETAGTAAITTAAITPATPASNPYPLNASGYDVGFPNCSETPPGGFAIVGLGAGRPFTTSACQASEWIAARRFNGTPGPALYFNTAYDGSYARNITPGCTTYNGPSLSGVAKHDQNVYAQAWRIGCSEADYAAGVAASNHETPTMWWADIETDNSWSTDQTVNRYTVDGLSWSMSTTATDGWGVYSYSSSWAKIVGTGFAATPAFSGDWGPGLKCGTNGFDGSAVWLVQGATTSTGVDTDRGCG